MEKRRLSLYQIAHQRSEVQEKIIKIIHLLLGFNFQLQLFLEVLNPGVGLVQLDLDPLHEVQLVGEGGQLVPQTPHLPTAHLYHQLQAVHLATNHNERCVFEKSGPPASCMYT